MYLCPDSATSDAMHNRRRSRSPCLSSNYATDEPILVCSEPDQRIFRRNTAPIFCAGKVFQIEPAAEYASLAGRFILVIGRSGSSVVCLTLRRHERLNGREHEFLIDRVRLYTKVHEEGGEQVAPEHFKPSPCPPLHIELEPGRRLFRDVWVNLAEPLTVHNANDVAVEYHGAIDDGDFSRLKVAYIVTQARMFNCQQGGPSMLVFHLLLLCVWAGCAWVGWHFWRTEANCQD